MNRYLKAMVRPLMPRSVRRRRIWSGPLRGAWLVTSWHDYPAAIVGYTERALLAWLESNVRVGETWLDVGAHYGYTAVALSRLVGAHGRVFAFEPVLMTAGYLSETLRLNALTQATVLPLALGSPPTIELMRLPATRGMVDRTVRIGTDPETVLVARLDCLWPRICGHDQRIDGIKIDVQGMEICVLEGMAELLKRRRPRLVVELHQGVDRAEFLRLLDTLGYESRAVPIERESELEPQYLDDRSYAFGPR